MEERIDVLDMLQEEDGFVEMLLTSGKTIYCKPKCIVYDEDEDGDETIKQIMVEITPFNGENMRFCFLEEIKSYKPIDEDDIPV